MKWLDRLLNRRRIVTSYVWNGLSLAQWRSSEMRVKQHAALLNSHHGKEMIAVLTNTMPIPNENNGLRTAGYYECLQTLIQMAKHAPRAMREPVADYSTSVEEILAQDSERQ